MNADPANESAGKTWILISTIILSAFLLCIGRNPSTGIALIMLGGLLSLTAWVSLLSIAIKGIKFFRFKNQKKSYSVIKFLRPITLFLVAAILLFFMKPHKQQAEAIKFLEKQAEIATAICNSDGKCPESLEGWVKYYDRYQYKFTSSGNTLFYMFYVANDKTFNIEISYALDMRDKLKGGVNMQIARVGEHAP